LNDSSFGCRVLVCVLLFYAAGPCNEHVFISYHLSFEETAIDIRDKLKEAGFRVWIDIDDMRTSCIALVAASVQQ